jgi:hypothetical protein
MAIGAIPGEEGWFPKFVLSWLVAGATAASASNPSGTPIVRFLFVATLFCCCGVFGFPLFFLWLQFACVLCGSFGELTVNVYGFYWDGPRAYDAKRRQVWQQRLDLAEEPCIWPRGRQHAERMWTWRPGPHAAVAAAADILRWF